MTNFEDFEDFFNFISKDLGINIDFPEIKEDKVRVHYPVKKSTDPQKSFLSVRWCTGGKSGGSCWGHEANWDVSSDREPDFVDLDTILENIALDISFLKYKNLTKKLIKIEDDIIENEYYGNYRVYSEKRVYLRELYDCLKEEKFI